MNEKWESRVLHLALKSDLVTDGQVSTLKQKIHDLANSVPDPEDTYGAPEKVAYEVVRELNRGSRVFPGKDYASSYSKYRLTALLGLIFALLLTYRAYTAGPRETGNLPMYVFIMAVTFGVFWASEGATLGSRKTIWKGLGVTVLGLVLIVLPFTVSLFQKVPDNVWIWGGISIVMFAVIALIMNLKPQPADPPANEDWYGDLNTLLLLRYYLRRGERIRLIAEAKAAGGEQPRETLGYPLGYVKDLQLKHRELLDRKERLDSAITNAILLPFLILALGILGSELYTDGNLSTWHWVLFVIVALGCLAYLVAGLMWIKDRYGVKRVQDSKEAVKLKTLPDPAAESEERSGGSELATGYSVHAAEDAEPEETLPHSPTHTTPKDS
ncbi:hypothetical protein BSR28_01070 [Boudabousia liubingyangii]|uniref:hypothetical protein n=1 Tax=Boudabousia liubingyangii TaxID=1921764 RepID=UPI000961A74D|nr:hypothetical protein [Boudabousia liubingyangii]OKL48327.1 hypothetical protein BSR28_01070 [Boudabousia liubingyangii]